MEMFNAWISKKSTGFKNNIKITVFFFTIILGIVYVDVRWITCRYSECLSKVYPPKNIIQDKCNQDWCKSENQQCV